MHWGYSAVGFARSPEPYCVFRPVLDRQVGRLLVGEGVGEEVGDLEVGQEGDGEIDGHAPEDVVAVERAAFRSGSGIGDHEIDLALGEVLA